MKRYKNEAIDKLYKVKSDELRELLGEEPEEEE